MCPSEKETWSIVIPKTARKKARLILLVISKDIGKEKLKTFNEMVEEIVLEEDE